MGVGWGKGSKREKEKPRLLRLTGGLWQPWLCSDARSFQRGWPYWEFHKSGT